MHASEAFLDGAAQGDLTLVNVLRAQSSGVLSPLGVRPAAGARPTAVVAEKSADERQAEEESQRESANKPGGFKNDPDDPTNPNEVRENHLEKVKKVVER